MWNITPAKITAFTKLAFVIIPDEERNISVNLHFHGGKYLRFVRPTGYTDIFTVWGMMNYNRRVKYLFALQTVKRDIEMHYPDPEL